MDFLFWNVKGYSGIKLTEEDLNNKNYTFDEIKKIDSNILKKVNHTLKNDGVVFALSKKKIIKAVYLFKIEEKNKQKVLVFDEKFVLDEVNKCVKEFEDDFDAILDGILVSRCDIDKVIWKNKELTHLDRLKSNIKWIKTIIWFGIVVSCVIALALIVCGSVYSLGSSIYSIDEIKNDETLINYVSDIKSYSYVETLETFSNIDNKNSFILHEIVMPTLFSLFGYILLIVSFIEILNFIKNLMNNRILSVRSKINSLDKIYFKIFIALFFIINNFVLSFGIVVLFAIRYLFNECFQFSKNCSLLDSDSVK